MDATGMLSYQYCEFKKNSTNILVYFWPKMFRIKTDLN